MSVQFGLFYTKKSCSIYRAVSAGTARFSFSLLSYKKRATSKVISLMIATLIIATLIIATWWSTYCEMITGHKREEKSKTFAFMTRFLSHSLFRILLLFVNESRGSFSYSLTKWFLVTVPNQSHSCVKLHSLPLVQFSHSCDWLRYCTINHLVRI